VTDVSRAVGCSSASHFIKEFRSRFGTTPRAYVDAQALGDQMAALRQA
jgi:AraC-like DNA-binding protein